MWWWCTFAVKGFSSLDLSVRHCQNLISHVMSGQTQYFIRKEMSNVRRSYFEENWAHKLIIKAKSTLSARAMATSGFIDSITEPVLCTSCKFNYSFAEESDRVNTFNCYLLQSFCNNNKQMMVQLPRQLNHQQHQDSDLPPLDLTSIDSQSKDLLSE